MRDQRKAFTMIELIFVLVVIGILSAIAIPKFAATRTDAKIVSILASVNNVMNNVRASYMANPSSVQSGQDWYGGRYNSSNKNGGCISVFTVISGGAVLMYVSKYSSHNTCSLNAADRADLFSKAEKNGIQWGKYRRKDGTINTAAGYYIEQLNGARLDL